MEICCFVQDGYFIRLMLYKIFAKLLQRFYALQFSVGCSYYKLPFRVQLLEGKQQTYFYSFIISKARQPIIRRMPIKSPTHDGLQSVYSQVSLTSDLHVIFFYTQLVLHVNFQLVFYDQYKIVQLRSRVQFQFQLLEDNQSTLAAECPDALCNPIRNAREQRSRRTSCTECRAVVYYRRRLLRDVIVLYKFIMPHY